MPPFLLRCRFDDAKTVFLSHLYTILLILPRQARDKHRESSQKQTVFLQSKHCVEFETRLVELARSDDSGREPAAAAAGSGSEVLSDGKSYTRLSAEVVSLDESVGDLTVR